LIGWRSVSGVVTAVDPPYKAQRRGQPLMFLLKLVLVIAVAPFVLALVIGLAAGLFVFKTGLSMMWGHRDNRRQSHPGLVHSLVNHILTYTFVGAIFGPKPTDDIRDFRLRDETGREHFVRVRGELSAGNVNVGDELRVRGFSHRGTIELTSGVNERTRSRLIVRRR